MAAESIEQLTARYKDLDKKKTIAETQLATATDELEKLKTESRKQWGTDDIAELEQKLKEMRAANEKQRAEYQAHLDAIDSKLSAVEKEFKQTS
ncbi:MAG: hypothetical protein JO353_08405 [Phycisphaerae bacterium]|nr:hypothetical protein [Phycisphaerae bacterium]